jgi:hypothetical protein
MAVRVGFFFSVAYTGFGGSSRPGALRMPTRRIAYGILDQFTCLQLSKQLEDFCPSFSLLVLQQFSEVRVGS